MIDLPDLGAAVRASRERRGLSVAQLAQACAVSASMVSSVERGEKAPTVVLLSRIADGLGLTLRQLLEAVEPDRVLVQRRTDHVTVQESGDWSRTVISPVVPGINFEWIEVTLPPRCAPDPFAGYAAGSHEFVHVSTGRLTVDVAGTTYHLHRQDTLYFPSDTEHAYRNETDRPCRYAIAAIVLRARTPRAQPG